MIRISNPAILQQFHLRISRHNCSHELIKIIMYMDAKSLQTDCQHFAFSHSQQQLIFKDPAIQRSANQQTEKFIQLCISPLPYSISLQHYYSNYQSRRTLTSIQNYSGASNNHRFVNCDIVCSLRFRFSTRISKLPRDTTQLSHVQYRLICAN